MLQVLAVHGVLLHLSESMTLENVAEETVVCFFEALQVVLKHLIFTLCDLDLAKGECRVKSILNLIQVEDVLVDGVDVQVLNHHRQVVLSNDERLRRQHTVVHVGVRPLSILTLGRSHLPLDVPVHFVADH